MSTGVRRCDLRGDLDTSITYGFTRKRVDHSPNYLDTSLLRPADCWIEGESSTDE